MDALEKEKIVAVRKHLEAAIAAELVTDFHMFELRDRCEEATAMLKALEEAIQ